MVFEILAFELADKLTDKRTELKKNQKNCSLMGIIVIKKR